MEKLSAQLLIDLVQVRLEHLTPVVHNSDSEISNYVLLQTVVCLDESSVFTLQ